MRYRAMSDEQIWQENLAYSQRNMCNCGMEHVEYWWGIESILDRHHDAEHWERGWFIPVNGEYTLEVKYCPECGVKCK